MKRSASRQSFKLNLTDFFVKNIGILGLVVVILFLAIYIVMQRISNVENRIMNLELNNSSMNKNLDVPTNPVEMKK